MSKQLELAMSCYQQHKDELEREMLKQVDLCIEMKYPPESESAYALVLNDGLFFPYTCYSQEYDDYQRKNGTEEDGVEFIMMTWVWCLSKHLVWADDNHQVFKYDEWIKHFIVIVNNDGL